ncbi:MAG TPA: hypothetical protein VFI21_05355 [Nocardioides sp.]|nr:hypothetical protein [Nocardioides sp.]
MRTATAARLGLGALCLTATDRVLSAVGGSGSRARLVTRLLGARLLLQAGLDVAWGDRTRRPDAMVELTHAASMVSVAAVSPRYRAPALTSAALATGTAALDLVPGGRGVR